jgi:hypothetical protein
LCWSRCSLPSWISKRYYGHFPCFTRNSPMIWLPQEHMWLRSCRCLHKKETITGCNKYEQ